MWNLKKTKQSKNGLIETETKGMVARGEGGGGRESCVKKVKGDLINNIVISLHSDR